MLPQDLHIHTTYSASDDVVVPEQTIALITAVGHARILGISDHFESLADGVFDRYRQEVRQAGARVGVEVKGFDWADDAAACNVDYYIVHCHDRIEDYRCLENLLATGKPVIVAHPNALGTDLERVPPECLVEINNRYVWQCDWRAYYGPHRHRFGFVISSDAHQPNWLGQSVARHVAQQLGIEEQLLF